MGFVYTGWAWLPVLASGPCGTWSSSRGGASATNSLVVGGRAGSRGSAAFAASCASAIDVDSGCTATREESQNARFAFNPPTDEHHLTLAACKGHRAGRERRPTGEFRGGGCTHSRHKGMCRSHNPWQQQPGKSFWQAPNSSTDEEVRGEHCRKGSVVRGRRASSLPGAQLTCAE